MTSGWVLRGEIAGPEARSLSECLDGLYRGGTRDFFPTTQVGGRKDPDAVRQAVTTQRTRGAGAVEG